MKHTIATAAGRICIEPGAKSVSIKVKPGVWPEVTLSIRPEDATLIAQALELSAQQACSGVRCHGDACLAGQIECPTKKACGVQS